MHYFVWNFYAPYINFEASILCLLLCKLFVSEFATCCELVQTFKQVIRPEVNLCSWWDVKIQDLTLLLLSAKLRYRHSDFIPRSGELRMQKLKSHLVRTKSLNVLPLKPGVCQYIAIHATLTARDFFLAYFYPSGPFTCIVFQNISRFLLCWLWLTRGSCVGPQNKIDHPAGCRFPCWLPAEYK